MKIISGIVAAIVLVLGVFYVWFFLSIQTEPVPVDEEAERIAVETPAVLTEETSSDEVISTYPPVFVLAENLSIPWDIVFLSNTDMLVAERTGVLTYRTGEGIKASIDVPDVLHTRGGEGGLLGMVAHPNFHENKYLYLYLTSSQSEEVNASVNTVVRYTYEGGVLTNKKIIVDAIPGSLYHNGGRIAFGPDGYLYITTGDARVPESAQDITSLAGKILRVTDEGGIPGDNPFGTAVYSYGHRNPQGLTWDDAGNLWSTEHGRTNATQTGMDELNLVISGGNYGWPESEGDTVASGTIGPVIHSGASATWAPGGAVFYNGSIFFGGLKGEALYEAVLNDARDDVVTLTTHLKQEYGRIRTTLVGPDGALYIMTSNKDNRGTERAGDDRIIRFDIAVLLSE